MMRCKFYFELPEYSLELSCIPYDYDAFEFLNHYLARYYDFYLASGCRVVFPVSKADMFDIFRTFDCNCKQVITKKVKKYGKR